jgi:two-component system chemotaxis response regulator CheB
MIKVLIVDDSKVIQEFLNHLLSSDPEIRVVGIASSGNEAIQIAREEKPDLITMDIHMPGMNGYEATRKLMETVPTPIVIVSGNADLREAGRANKYIEAGAVAVILRPEPFQITEFASFRNELIQTVKLMSEIKVVKIYSRNRKDQNLNQDFVRIFDNDLRRIHIIAIGASTGGPLALQAILSRLPENLSVPVLIVQHIAPGFVKLFQKMLSSTSGINLKIAEDGEPLKAGIGYIAPDNFHMGISEDNRIILSNQQPENGSKPSVSYLFRSVAKIYGANALGVLLTGMGRDGADELKDMKDKGAITVVQNEESSVVFGMPGEALRIGAANQSLSPEMIAQIIIKANSKKMKI